MKLWKLSQEQNSNWDTYDALIVAAPDQESARRIGPYNNTKWDENGKKESNDFGVWANDLSAVEVEYIGEAKEGTEPGVILGSFNEG